MTTSTTAKQNETADRIHLLKCNAKEANSAAVKAPGHVIALCDSRDKIARKVIKGVTGYTENELKRVEAPMILGGTVPTFVLALNPRFAVELTATFAPSTSVALGRFPMDEDTPIVVIASGGTSMSTLATLNAEVG